jgi:choline dehydrogenase-like flavoprotein
MMNAVTHGREVRAPIAMEADLVVVGSGAGGAVLARELASEGKNVVVVEEGGYWTPEQYSSMRPSNVFRRMAREASLGTAIGVGQTPLIAVLAGKCVGGSSVLTGGVCFRIPDDVLEGWVRDLGLSHMTPEALDRHFAAVERAIGVETVPAHMRSRSTELFVEGAAELGIQMKPLRRNTGGCCTGISRCNFGCPNIAKMSVDISYLPDACARGARILSDALVERVVLAKGRAAGVRGRFLDERGTPSVPFEIAAKAVVVACGALHTPLLLRASGVGGRHLGRGLSLHPSVRVYGIFEERVDGWDGAFQSAYSDDFVRDGIMLISAFGTPSLLAGGFPGIGREHRRFVHMLPHTAAFGAIIHDEGGGRVRRVFAREPLVSYHLVERDRRRLMRAIRILANMAFAAGARQVVLPIFGAPAIATMRELDDLLARAPSMRRVECVSFHPLGSAKMGVHADAGVVKPSGETWAVDNLFVADGSVLPTSIGVNPQVPVMAVARFIAHGIAANWQRVVSKS